MPGEMPRSSIHPYRTCCIYGTHRYTGLQSVLHRRHTSLYGHTDVLYWRHTSLYRHIECAVLTHAHTHTSTHHAVLLQCHQLHHSALFNWLVSGPSIFRCLLSVLRSLKRRAVSTWLCCDKQRLPDTFELTRYRISGFQFLHKSR